MLRLRRPAAVAALGRRLPSVAEPLEGRRLLAANLNFTGPSNGTPALSYGVDGGGGAAATWSSELNVRVRGVQNFGDTVVPDVLVSFYLSTDATMTTADVLLGTARSTRELRPSDAFDVFTNSVASQRFETTATLPGVRPAGFAASGTYYLGAIVDPTNRVAETNEADNAMKFYSRAITFSGPAAQPARANLVFAAPPTVQATLDPRQPFTFSYTVRNAGTATSAPAALDAYLSADAFFDALDYRIVAANGTGLSTLAVPALQPGQSVTLNYARTFAQPVAGSIGAPLTRFAAGQTVRLGAILRSTETVDSSFRVLPESNTADNTTRFYVGNVTLAQATAGGADSNDQLVEARYAGSLANLGTAPFTQGNYVIDGAGDVDVFSFDVTAAGQRVDVRGAFGGLGLTVGILDGQGRTLARANNGIIQSVNDITSGETHVGHTFAQPGRYYAAVSANAYRAQENPYRGFDDFDARYGTRLVAADPGSPITTPSPYALTIRAVPDRDLDGPATALEVADANDTYAEAFNLGALGSGAGLSVPGAELQDDYDVDVYRFTAPAGAQVRVRSDALSSSVRVVTASGAILGSDGNFFTDFGFNDTTALPPDFTFTAPAGGGPLYFVISDVDNGDFNLATGTGDEETVPGFAGYPDGRGYYDVRITLV